MYILYVISFYKDGQPTSSQTTPSKKDSTSSSTAVSLMKRLTNIKRSKSPTPNSSSVYSMDNPVFEDSSVPCNSSLVATVAKTPQSTCTSPSTGSAAAATATKRNVQLAHPAHVRYII